MITDDQPTIFNNLPVAAAVSSLQDDGMHPNYDEHHKIFENITNFLEQKTKIALMRPTYDRTEYNKIVRIDEKSDFLKPNFEPMIIADALTTNTLGVSLILPIADCLGVTLYDPTNNASAIAHMGRHATIDNLLPKLVQHMTKEYGTEPGDLLAYLSPSIKKSHYFMEYWEHKDDPNWQNFYEEKNEVFYLDLPGFNKQRLIESGVIEKNIEVSTVNTAADSNYGSHFIHKVDPGKPSTRFLVTITIELAD